MGAPVQPYNENDHEHKCWADDLGTLLRTVDNGTYSTLPNSYYMGIEILEAGEVLPEGCEFRKKDTTGGSKGKGSRTQNRVVLAVNTATAKPVEGLGYLWRHDDRVLKLGAGFFKRAEMYRTMSL